MKENLIRYSLFLVLLLGAGACQPEPSGKNVNTPEKQTQRQEDWLEVRQPNFQLREAPGNEASPIQGLEPGERVLSLGEQSTVTTHLEIGGRLYDEPWLLVQSENGAQGWVYALAFQDSLNTGEGFPPGARLHALFGQALAQRIAIYEEAFEQAHTAEMVAQAMAIGRALRDTLVQVLALRALENDQRESLFWLKEAIPAFVPHLMEDGRTYYLFMDYRPYLSLARTSEGAADDAFLELCLMAYPEDSIEYFYPVWKFESNEKEVHSLLGRGLHFQFLEKLDKLLLYRDLYGEEIGQFREQLLNDIAGAGVTYWESREKALTELKRIQQANFQVIGEDGQQALEARRRQFEDPGKYGIRFNYKSGIYEVE